MRKVTLASMLGIFAALLMSYGQGSKPELHPVSLAFTPPSPVQLGEIVRVNSDIVNTGGSKAGKFLVEFHFCRASRSGGATNCLEGFKRFASDTVFSLDVGERKTVIGVLDPAKVKTEFGAELKGLYIVRVAVDAVVDPQKPKGQVEELDENNNELLALITVGPAIDPADGPPSSQRVWFDKLIATRPIRASPVIDVAKQAIYFGTDEGRLYAVSLKEIDPITQQAKLLFVFPKATEPPIGAIRSTPVIDEVKNAIYFGADDGKLYILDRSTGAQKFPDFSTAVPNIAAGAVRSTPAIDVSKNVIYFGADNGVFFAVDRDSGALPIADARKFRIIGDSIRTTPAIDSANNAIYFGTAGGKLLALDRDNFAEIKFTFATGGPILSSPIIDIIIAEDRIYMGSDDGKLYKIDRDRTRKKDVVFVSTGGPIRTTSAIDITKNAIYFVSDDGHLYALSRDEAKAIFPKVRIVVEGFPTPDDDLPRSSPKVDRRAGGSGTGIIFVGSFDSHLYVIEPDTGKVIKRFPTGGPVRTTPAIEVTGGGGTITLRAFFGSDDGKLHLVELRF